jgi:uncharacterized protein YraI
MLKKVVLRALVVAVILAVVAPAAGAQSESRGELNVDLNVRGGPGTAYAIVGELPTGTTVILEARDDAGGWLLAHTLDGEMRGWLARDFVYVDQWVRVMDLPVSAEQIDAPDAPSVDAEPAGDEAAPTVEGEPAPGGALSTSAIDYLNVRLAPAFDAEYVTTVAVGVELVAEARDADGYWVLVHTLDGAVRGWVASGFLSIYNTPELMTLPVSDAAVVPGEDAPPVTADDSAAPEADAATLAYPSTALNVRSGPGTAYNYLATAAQSVPLVLEGRNAADDWVLVRSEDETLHGWVSVDFLNFADGALAALPVIEEVEAAAVQPAPTSMDDILNIDPNQVEGGPDAPVIPASSSAWRNIYLRGQELGNDPQVFIKIGDCNSVTPYFLRPFDGYDYSLGDYAYLQPVIDHFTGSFWRDDMTAEEGITAYNLFDPTWADPAQCEGNENLLECAYRRYKPSVAFIGLGTNGHDLNTFSDDMRAVLDFLIAHGVIPILGTKADNVEGDGSVNAFIAQLARDYDVPLWNFWLASRALPDYGLRPDGFHLTWTTHNYNNPEAFEAGWSVRNLTALMVLDVVWREAMY